jgi:hypothetical protein
LYSVPKTRKYQLKIHEAVHLKKHVNSQTSSEKLIPSSFESSKPASPVYSDKSSDTCTIDIHDDIVDYDFSEVSFPELLSFQKPEPPVVEGSALSTPERVRTPDCVAVIAAPPIPVAVQEEPEVPVPLDLSKTSTA